ncbi:hypothetical protein EON65_58555 [archaeon]|nr:MAG: hypothetical protein EON65_58555 [archaeon]
MYSYLFLPLLATLGASGDDGGDVYLSITILVGLLEGAGTITSTSSGEEPMDRLLPAFLLTGAKTCLAHSAALRRCSATSNLAGFGVGAIGRASSTLLCFLAEAGGLPAKGDEASSSSSLIRRLGLVTILCVANQ